MNDMKERVIVSRCTWMDVQEKSVGGNEVERVRCLREVT